MKEYEYRELRTRINNIMGMELDRFIESHQDNDECLYEIQKCVNNAEIYGYRWNTEKAKIVLETLQLKNNGDIQEILSYLEKSSCGWQGHTYQLYNRCLRFDQRCRRNCYLGNTPKDTGPAL